jgi:hypothetical protein
MSLSNIGAASVSRAEVLKLREGLVCTCGSLEPLRVLAQSYPIFVHSVVDRAKRAEVDHKLYVKTSSGKQYIPRSYLKAT